jgi:hypothetical protein
MKTRALVAAACGLFALSASAMAFGPGNIQGSIPSSGTKAEATTKSVAKGALEAGINDNLKKQNCSFSDSKTDKKTTCDLNKIVADLKNWRDGLESTIANDVDVHIEASAADNDLAWKRVSYVQDQLKAKLSYWDWYTDKTTINGDKLKIWVKVH